MIPVTLGVLLALILNNWKESQSNQRFLNRVMQSIGEEMRENKASIEEILPLHEALIDTIHMYQQQDTISVIEVFTLADGLQAPRIKHTSWQSFLNTKIELVDYQTISVLTEIQEEKEWMNMKLSKLLDFLLEHGESNSSGKKQLLAVYISNIMDSEQRLLELHKKYFKI